MVDINGRLAVVAYRLATDRTQVSVALENDKLNDANGTHENPAKGKPARKSEWERESKRRKSRDVTFFFVPFSLSFSLSVAAHRMADSNFK